ncbi:MAG: PDZ domain-containing protein [Bacteroidetes bacterium]|jgi:carboxyl-terminal processing protease|nr:PDZ domain-containing protein [Bacteroidota bacterium]
MNRKKIIRNVIISITIITIPVVFLSFNEKEFKLVKNMDIFYNLFKEVNMYYVDDTDPEELINAGIEGMLEKLDPYTNYIAEEDMDDFEFMTTGQYGGIGALIRKAGDYTIISEPYTGFPAFKAGLQAGDTIVSIDGESVKGKDVSQVSDLLKGSPNTDFTIKILRYGHKDTLVKKITREKITIDNVPYAGIVKDNIGYIRLSNFTKDAGNEVRKSVVQLKNEGAESYILDLRSNPGGLLYEAVEVSNVFLPKNREIVTTKGRIKEYYKKYSTSDQPIDTVTPLVVLVNSASASASEIVAGAIQDYDRGLVIGQRTFGKGLVQTTRPLSYDSKLKVTTAKYYIPSGRCIQAIDYSHRNEDGSVGYIPDSLISEFETANGRIVYDGGGITPDIPLEENKPSQITVALYGKQLIFDYATIYAHKTDSIKGPLEFELSGDEYDRFVDYALGHEFEYNTNSFQTFEELVTKAKKERYYQKSVDEFEALKGKLNNDPKKDMYTFEEEIKEILREEIISRFYYQKGRIISAFKVDVELDEAVNILNNKSRYRSYLQPGTEVVALKKGKGK